MKGTLKRAYIWHKPQRILTSKELRTNVLKWYTWKNHEEFVEVLTSWVKQIGIEKNGRKVYLYEDFGYFGFFTCNKNFTNIRFKKEVPPLTAVQEKKIKKHLAKKPGTYIEGTEVLVNNKLVKHFFKIVGNIPVTYWINEDGEIYGIETV